MTKRILFHLAWTLFCYLIAAFVHWDILWLAHAGEWHVVQRIFAVMFAILATRMGVLIYSVRNPNHD